MNSEAKAFLAGMAFATMIMTAAYALAAVIL